MATSKTTKKNPTKQRKPSVGRGGVPTPPGFEAHPERRHNGAWKKEDTARFKLEKMVTLPDTALREILVDGEAPRFERDIARILLDHDMKPQEKWRVLEGMMNQVYGLPKQEVKQEVVEIKPLVDLTKRKKNGMAK